MAASSSMSRDTVVSVAKEPHEVVSLLKGEVVHGNEKGYWRPVPYRDHRFQLTLFDAKTLEKQQPDILHALQTLFPLVPAQGLRKILECINVLLKGQERQFLNHSIQMIPEDPAGTKKGWIQAPVSKGWILYFRLYYIKLLDKPNGINLWGHFHAIATEEIPERFQKMHKMWFYSRCLCCGYHKDDYYKKTFAKKQFSLMETTEGQLTMSQEFLTVDFVEVETV